MNLKNEILTKLAYDICGYLKLDEDLFFCGGHVSQRVCEGRRYFCYLAVEKFHIPANFVRSYLGFASVNTVNRHHKNIIKSLNQTQSIQALLDIEALKKICDEYLFEAA